MNNIKIVSASYLCSNCGACKAVCPKQAIDFKWTAIGRKYADIGDNCVDCGLCTKVCPSLNSTDSNYTPPPEKAYIVRANNSSIYENAQSGGAATAILIYLFDSKKIDCAIVCKMEFGKLPNIHAVIVESSDALFSCQKSCYTPVDLLSVLKNLDKSKRAAIVGLPCHLAGLSLLQRGINRYCNVIYKIGLICDRTLCAGIQNVIASYVNEDLIKIQWRKKDFTRGNIYYPYKSAPTVIVNIESKEKILPNYYRFALKDMFTSPRCQVCIDKLNRYADIVVGDPWDMEGSDMEHGDSVTIPQSLIGKELFKETVAYNHIIVKKKLDYQVVMDAQQIQKRVIKALNYRQALNSIVGNNSFPILSLDGRMPSTEVEKAYITLTEFIHRDELPESELLNLGQKKIAQSERAIKWSNNIIVKVLYKLRNIFHI